jgi:peptidoglycan/LPS O-acetylase OafA/YrhL
MGELGRYGPRLPHDEAAQREHFKEVDEDLSRDQEADRIAKRRSTRPRWGIGYLVVLLGVAGFVLSCFLPYTQFFDQVSISYYRLATASRGGTLEYVGGLMLLFGGTATVAWVALAGLRHGQHERRQTPSILLAVTVVWSLSWIGVVVSVSGVFGHEVGYWSMLVSVGVVIVGTVVVWISARPTKHEPDSTAGPEPPTEVPVD